MGMFSSKPPFDLTAFLAQKASPKASVRRGAWKPKPPAPDDEPENADPKDE
ncbi:hypothetical protein [Falsirhodobacter xinxiangensis]|uniref:hypothetical protein n=1 Tax=Falsirhodobacter xinxiangensis TaxID=2530049 RepID=UPI00145A619E|nr:hypothetical protein [Rhodobacter xinxiangensis]